MKRNELVTYEVVITHASEMEDGQLDLIVNAMESADLTTRILRAVWTVVHKHPGLAIDVYEDGRRKRSTTTEPMRQKRAS